MEDEEDEDEDEDEDEEDEDVYLFSMPNGKYHLPVEQTPELLVVGVVTDRDSPTSGHLDSIYSIDRKSCQKRWRVS